MNGITKYLFKKIGIYIFVFLLGVFCTCMFVLYSYGTADNSTSRKVEQLRKQLESVTGELKAAKETITTTESTNNELREELKRSQATARLLSKRLDKIEKSVGSCIEETDGIRGTNNEIEKSINQSIREIELLFTGNKTD